jgi:hypothetical protein
MKNVAVRNFLSKKRSRGIVDIFHSDLTPTSSNTSMELPNPTNEQPDGHTSNSSTVLDDKEVVIKLHPPTPVEPPKPVDPSSALEAHFMRHAQIRYSQQDLDTLKRTVLHRVTFRRGNITTMYFRVRKHAEHVMNNILAEGKKTKTEVPVYLTTVEAWVNQQDPFNPIYIILTGVHVQDPLAD